MPAEPVKASATEAPSKGGPVVVDLGKRSRKQIRALRRGEGKLLTEIDEVMGELKNAGTVGSGAQPVIIVVRPKRARAFGWPL